MLQNRLRGANYPIRCEAGGDRSRLPLRADEDLNESNTFVRALALNLSVRIERLYLVSWFFMKVWLSLFLRLVKLSKSHWSEILRRQGRLISYHGNCIKITFRQWQILTKKKCPLRNIYSSSHHVYKTASVMSKMNSFNSNRRI